jgi:hypothetical protein
LKNNKEKNMDWFKKHTDTSIVLGAILTTVLWMNGKFNDIDRRLIKIETILVMKGIMPSEWVSTKEIK